jgi:hypothetical protein
MIGRLLVAILEGLLAFFPIDAESAAHTDVESCEKGTISRQNSPQYFNWQLVLPDPGEELFGRNRRRQN